MQAQYAYLEARPALYFSKIQKQAQWGAAIGFALGSLGVSGGVQRWPLVFFMTLAGGVIGGTKAVLSTTPSLTARPNFSSDSGYPPAHDYRKKSKF